MHANPVTHIEPKNPTGELTQQKPVSTQQSNLFSTQVETNKSNNKLQHAADQSGLSRLANDDNIDNWHSLMGQTYGYDQGDSDSQGYQESEGIREMVSNNDWSGLDVDIARVTKGKLETEAAFVGGNTASTSDDQILINGKPSEASNDAITEELFHAFERKINAGQEGDTRLVNGEVSFTTDASAGALDEGELGQTLLSEFNTNGTVPVTSEDIFATGGIAADDSSSIVLNGTPTSIEETRVQSAAGLALDNYHLRYPFPYSEYPEATRADLGLGSPDTLVLDIGGEGQKYDESLDIQSGNAYAINLNDKDFITTGSGTILSTIDPHTGEEHTQITTTDTKIPNLVRTDGDWNEYSTYPFAADVANGIMIEGAPMSETQVSEIARTIQDDGWIMLKVSDIFEPQIQSLATKHNGDSTGYTTKFDANGILTYIIPPAEALGTEVVDYFGNSDTFYHDIMAYRVETGDVDPSALVVAQDLQDGYDHAIGEIREQAIEEVNSFDPNYEKRNIGGSFVDWEGNWQPFGDDGPTDDDFLLP